MNPTLKWISVATLVACGLPWAPLFAENVYRYTDENGDVHYSATLPPEYANKPYEIIGPTGIVLERIDPMAIQVPKVVEKKEPEPLYNEEEIRLRSDRLLVLKYHSEEDIFEAMNVEIANLGYDARILDQTQASLVKSLAAQVKEAADRQRAGMPPQEATVQEIESLQARLREGAAARAALETRELEIRAMFMAELERYRYLQSGGQPGSVMPESGSDG